MQAAWSPDGATIAFVSRVRDAAYDEEDDKRRAPRRFARLQYKLEHVGWTADRPTHLFTVPADGSGRAGADHLGRRRRRLSGLVARRRHAGLRLGAPPRLGHRAGERRLPRRRRRRRRRRRAAAPHPGRRRGRAALVVAPGRPHRRAALPGRLRRPPAHPGGGGRRDHAAPSRCSRGELDRNCGTYPNMREPIWDGDDLVFIAEDHGNVHLYRVAADGAGKPRARWSAASAR